MDGWMQVVRRQHKNCGGTTSNHITFTSLNHCGDPESTFTRLDVETEREEDDSGKRMKYACIYLHPENEARGFLKLIKPLVPGQGLLQTGGGQQLQRLVVRHL